MANEIVHAVTLGKDADFRDWVNVAARYQARVVIGEPVVTPDHAQRLQLATEVAFGQSAARLIDLWVNVLSTDPAICGVSPAAVDIAGAGTGVTQPLLLAQIAGSWSAVAKALYPTV